MTNINIMALRHSAFYTPLLLTICGGFLRGEGLEPHYTLATPDNTVADALRSGEAHLSQFAPAASFADLERGLGGDLVHFAQINARDGFFIAGRQSTAEFDWHNLQHVSGWRDFHDVEPESTGTYRPGKRGNSLSPVQGCNGQVN